MRGGEGLSGDGARSQDDDDEDDEDGDDEREEEEYDDDDEEKSGEMLEFLLKCTNNTIKA